ncbi:MAG: transcription antitermination factor NusB [Candidatus Saccharicenans sp.]
MGKRRKARECALQILFQLEFTEGELSSVFSDYWKHQKQPAEVKEYAEWLVRGIRQHQAEVDRKIQEASKNWRLERMANVDRNVLRIAVFEMLYEKNLAPPIIINEAIEVAKKFSGQEAGVFINGILDGVYRNLKKQGQMPEWPSDENKKGEEDGQEEKQINKPENKSEEEVKENE